MADIFTKCNALNLLKKKQVIFIGDSNVRAFYKDCVALLVRNSFLQDTELKSKLVPSFLNDKLIKGDKLTRGRDYEEQREFKIADVFLKFYFVTRCYNQTIEDLVTNIKEGKVPVPDVIIMNSCLWDISRWGPKGVSAYKDNLLKLMKFFKKSLPPQTLVIWTTTLPISSNAYGGFLIKQVDFLKHTLRFEVMEANLYARDVVATHGYDIVDLHYYFSMQLERRANDGIHWLPLAVRFMTNILLTHIALSWDHPLPGNITCSLLDDVVNLTDKSSVADIELPQVPLALRSDESTTYTKTAVVNKQVHTPVQKPPSKKSKKRKAKRNASPKLKIQQIQQPNLNPWVQNSFLRNPSTYVNEYLNGVNSYIQSINESLRNSLVSGSLNDVSKNYQFGNIAPIEYDKYGMPVSRPSYYHNQPSSYSHRSDNRHSRRPKPY